MEWRCLLVAWTLGGLVGEAHAFHEASNAPEARPVPEARPLQALYHLSQHPAFKPKGFYSSAIKFLGYMKNNPDTLACLLDITTVLSASTAGIGDGMWAIKILDAGSKIPSGILEGNTVDLGQFDECVYTGYGHIAGQHCLATFNFHVKNFTGFELEELGGNVSLRMSYCVPDKCSAEMLRLVLEPIAGELTHLLNHTRVSVRALLEDTDCKTASSPPLDTLDLAVIWVLTLLIMVVIAATLVDCFLRSKKPHEELSQSEALVVAFSLYSNSQRLFSTKRAEDHIECLDGLRFLSLLYVLFGHKMMLLIYPGLPSVNYVTALKGIENWQSMIYIHSMLSVDTFFIISGLLTAYGMCAGRDYLQRFTIWTAVRLYIHRFIRLTPALVVMIALTATLQYHTGNGPVWDMMVLPQVKACRDNWWTNIIYLNNYLISSEHYCLPQSWYLSSDMQLFVAAPLVVLPLWKWPILGYCLLALLTAASIAATFCTAYFYKITTTMPLHFQLKPLYREMDLLFTPTHLRVSSYTTGILIGYLLYRMNVKKDASFNIPKVVGVMMWILAGVCMCYAVFGGHYLYIPPRPHDLVLSSLFIAFYRFLWCLGVAWVILACSQGYGGFINGFLSLKIFRPLARLSYCAYLCHVFIYLIKIGGIKQADYLSAYKAVTSVLGDFLVIMPMAAFLHLMVESPSLMLEKLVLTKSPQISGQEEAIGNQCHQPRH